MTVALFRVLFAALLVKRSSSVWPSVMLPVVPHVPPLMRNCGVPSPVMLTAVAVLMPLMVKLSDVICVETATPVWSVKLKATGVVSGGVS